MKKIKKHIFPKSEQKFKKKFIMTYFRNKKNYYNIKKVGTSKDYLFSTTVKSICYNMFFYFRVFLPYFSYLSKGVKSEQKCFLGRK